MKKINWTNSVRYEEILPTVVEKTNILHAIKRMMANWISHIMCRNCPYSRRKDTRRIRSDRKVRKMT
jgi:hypothetical protein